MLKWEKLYRISEMPFIKQTYMFVVLIPMLSSLINTTDNIVTKVLTWGRFSLSFPVTLPVKWELLFFSSLVFLLGRIGVSFFAHPS